MNENLYLEILPPEQIDLFNILSDMDWIRDFYLVGGTALALQIGHRQSFDFDFFTTRNFQADKLMVQAKEIGQFELYGQDKDTLNAAINGVRVSFFKSPLPLIHETHRYKKLSITDKFDIALMKLNAISGRGNKKDFIDLYFLIQEYAISDLLKAYQNHYGIELGNIYHLYKSLVYFADAENQPTPMMLKPIQWHEIKEKMIFEVTRLPI